MVIARGSAYLIVMTERAQQHDILIAGAGLAASLVALRLGHEARVTLVDPAHNPLAGHTWSFHDADIAGEDKAWLSPAVAHRWPGQEVRFPHLRRRLASSYASVTPESLAAALAALPNLRRITARVATLAPNHLALEDGTRLDATLVIDARGFEPHPALTLGFQKFLGLEIETSAPHGINVPVIMDATVRQEDGYRFLYLLPFSPTRLLIEDTRYADGADLSPGAIRAGILAHARAQGWTANVVAEESGVLPIALGLDARAFWADRPADIPTIGMRAARFHPVTGYSLPDAVRSASLIAAHWREGSAPLAARLRDDAIRTAEGQGFYRLLARMLFRAAEPAARWKVLQRFYGLPEPLIERFYAGRTTKADMARILIGRPPVPVHRALACLREPTRASGDLHA